MAYSLATVTLLGLFFGAVVNKLKLPSLLGMLLIGILIGPYGLGIIDDKMLMISADLRKIALVIILLRAGLGIKKDMLAKVGSAAIKISIIPVLLEGATITFVAMKLLHFSLVEAGMLAFIVAAVSPAVVVPQMLTFMKRQIGTNKGIPTLILAGTSVDDVVAITLFSSFLGLYLDDGVSLLQSFMLVPVSIVLGISLGILVGHLLSWVYRKVSMRNTEKILVLLGVAILFTGLEQVLRPYVSIASLLGVMAIGFILQKDEDVSVALSSKSEKLWVFAQVILFVMVGAQVNVDVAVNAGLVGLAVIMTGLLARSVGVLLSLNNSQLNFKERLFCVISYTPKATVQAAMGAVPLSYAVGSGEMILAIAVLSIIITAPIGAIGISVGSKYLLSRRS